MDTVTQDGTTKIDYGYDANGNLTSRSNTNLPANTVETSATYTYNAANLMTSSNGTRYRYYLNGKLSAEDRYNGQYYSSDVSYKYDNLGRLTEENDVQNDIFTTYSYDNYDNITGAVSYNFNGTYSNIPFKTENSAYNNANQLTEHWINRYDENSGDPQSEVYEAYNYLDGANRTRKESYATTFEGGISTSYTCENYTYDALNRMSQYIKTANGQSTISNYQHSTDNQVVKVGATDLYWDGSRITYEQSGSTGTSYVLGLAVEGISGANEKSTALTARATLRESKALLTALWSMTPMETQSVTRLTTTATADTSGTKTAGCI